MDCIFCKIVSGEIKSKFLKETKHSVSFLDAFPLATGHVLIIPKNHHQKIHPSRPPRRQSRTTQPALPRRRTLQRDGQPFYGASQKDVEGVYEVRWRQVERRGKLVRSLRAMQCRSNPKSRKSNRRRVYKNS